MAAEPAGEPSAPPPGLGSRVRAAAGGMGGFAVAVVASLSLILALWLAANGAPSAEGEPFRFTPPTETPAAVTSVTATPAPTESR